jgi:hypothetical protein
MMKRVLLFVFFAAATGCFDTASPEKQCDPSRRCVADDTPVCGGDGVWYECALVAECEQVAVVFDESICDDQQLNNQANSQNNDSTCGAVSCREFDCISVEEVLDENGCVVDCQCAPFCPEISGSCLATEVVDGCEVCVECSPIACPLECGERCLPDGYAECDCEPPICERIDSDACLADPTCDIVIGENGCENCVCDDNCSRDFCDIFCENGYVIENGCPTCKCHEPCNEGPECDLACPTGNTIDPATGCSQSCECIADECSPVVCALFCEFGFRTDGSGCEVCECRGEPCFDLTQCAVDQVCVPAYGPSFDEVPEGQCVTLELCSADGTCADGGHCGFQYRPDCCPPLTTCTDNIASCPALCLLELGDL